MTDPHAATSASAAPTSLGAPARALGQPHERLEVALRPGQPGRREAEDGGAERPGALRDIGEAPRRAAGSRTTPPRLSPARPTSNCGLTIASAS